MLSLLVSFMFFFLAITFSLAFYDKIKACIYFFLFLFSTKRPRRLTDKEENEEERKKKRKNTTEGLSSGEKTIKERRVTITTRILTWKSIRENENLSFIHSSLSSSLFYLFLLFFVLLSSQFFIFSSSSLFLKLQKWRFFLLAPKKKPEK